MSTANAIKPATAAIQTESPFHPGERQVQQRAGVREEAETRGRRMLSADLNDSQVQFFAQLPFLVTSHVDDRSQPWASLITGDPGFISIDTQARQFALDWQRASNPNRIRLHAGSNLGLLGIELQSRRRNRLNGTVYATDEQRWRALIDQGYGNCPRYITERPWPAERFGGSYQLAQSAGLAAGARAAATRTDTFFIASASGPQDDKSHTYAAAWGNDISHRGGEPGFLRFDAGKLVFDDFPGNNMFNTLGNLLRHPLCGLLILDFSSGDIWQLAARADVVQADEARSVSLDIISTQHWFPVPA